LGASTEDAYATTGELLFGSNKDKSVPDIFVLGRSDDEIEVSVWSGETTKRIYPITFNSSGQADLKNKRRDLAKGLKSTNWKFQFKKTGTTSAEIRSADLYVNELKRHT
jgi:hypothetical protein